MISEDRIDRWRRRYGIISKVKVEGVEYVLRGLQFEELYKWSPFIKAGEMGARRVYEIDPQIIGQVLTAGILYPETVDTKQILAKAGTSIELCNIIMRITQFENEEFLINTYLDKHRSANMFYGMVRMKLLAIYGVGVIEHLRNMTSEEIIELFVYSEYATDSVGLFADILRKPEILPRDRQGKVIRAKFMETLFGNEYKEQLGDTEKPPKATLDLPKKPRTIDDLQSMMETVAEPKTPSDVEMDKSGGRSYAKVKNERRIRAKGQFQNKFKDSIDDARTALEKQIDADRQAFGTNAAGHPGGFRGNIKDLLEGK
jgi:hypothetical protein